MNIKFVIIGAVLIILVVAFGRNPVEEGRERRAEAMKGKDPLVYAIQEHNSGNKMGGGLSRGTNRSAEGFSPRGPRGTSAKNLPPGAIKVGDSTRSWRTQNRSTMYGTPPSVTQKIPSSSVQQSQGGYYPPPASSSR